MNAVVVLAMHGAPPRDFPEAELNEFFGLHARHEAAAGRTPPEITDRYHALERRLRDWPRTEVNDPFWAGSMAMAEALQASCGLPVRVGFNEFCAPRLSDALDDAAKAGSRRVLVVTPMMTRGGDHSEVDIPDAVSEARARHPGVSFEYVWPLPLEEVADFLARQLDRYRPAGPIEST